MKFETLNLEGEWQASLGEPQLSGAWLAWGCSGSGKTSFALLLAKYLSNFGVVAFDSLELGIGKALQRSAKIANLSDVKPGRIIFIKERVDQLRERLKKHKSPKIIIIDSFQYLRIKYADYLELKEEFPDKLFIFISHADGKNPRSSDAESVRFDADIKIFVEGYAAYPTSRFGGGEPYIIWREKYDELNNY